MGEQKARQLQDEQQKRVRVRETREEMEKMNDRLRVINFHQSVLATKIHQLIFDYVFIMQQLKEEQKKAELAEEQHIEAIAKEKEDQELARKKAQQEKFEYADLFLANLIYDLLHLCLAQNKHKNRRLLIDRFPI
jgi:hypothetical protein